MVELWDARKTRTAINTALNKALQAARNLETPFQPGGRYISPVTYFWPDYYNQDSQWARTLKLGSSLGYVILNRNNGTWDEYDHDFQTQAQHARNAGAKRILAYVKTQYGWATDLDGAQAEAVPDADKYTAAYILTQINNVVSHYPGLIDGVFLDEFINGWSNAQAARIDWYRNLITAIREAHGNGFTVAGNPGANVSEAVLALDTDVLMTFEGTAEKYLADDPSAPVHPDSHRALDSRRFWHCIHDVTPELTEQVLAKAADYGVAHVYATDGNLVLGEAGAWQPEGNPYAKAPTDRLIAATRMWALGLQDALTVQAAAETYATSSEVAELRALIEDIQGRL